MTIHRVGILSDTHGLLRPEAVVLLHGVEVIIHAGDVGQPEVLARLRQIAPVHAVRGNVDTATWAQSLPLTAVVQFGDVHLYVLHNLNTIDLDPVAAGFQVVISGHSHQPAMQRRNGVLYLNPGSAGPRRFSLPVTLALMTINGSQLQPTIVPVVT